MNKFLKSALCVAGVAGAFSAAEAQAVSFTVVIDKIELVEDADNYPNTAFTVYEPRSDIGEATTKTVDLFDATSKLGTTYTLAKPDSGVYESALIYFSEIKAVSGSDEINMLDVYTTAGTFAKVGNTGVMVLGADGAGVALDDSIETAYTTAVAPMQSIIADGSADISMPALDLFLPEAALVATGTSGVALSEYPRITLAVSQATDSASRANVTVNVDPDTAFTGEAGWSTASSVVTVGLFDSNVPETPLMTSTFTATSATAATDVEFIDVPHNISLHPIAWIDSDEDGRLDAGEAFTVFSLTKATNLIAVVESDVDSTANVLDEPAIDFPARTVSLAISMTDDTTVSAGNDYALAANESGASGLIMTTGGTTAIAGSNLVTDPGVTATLTFVIWADASENISSSIDVPVRFAGAAGATVAGVVAGDVMDLVLADGSTDLTAFGNLSYTAGTGLTITGIPAYQSDTFAADLTGIDAHYQVSLAVSDGTESSAFVLDEGTETILATDSIVITGTDDVDAGGDTAFD